MSVRLFDYLCDGHIHLAEATGLVASAKCMLLKFVNYPLDGVPDSLLLNMQ